MKYLSKNTKILMRGGVPKILVVAEMTQAPSITITSQPSNQTANSGAATFSVTATITLSATLAYQWQKQSLGAGIYANLSGATSASLSLNGLTYSGNNGDNYRCLVSGSGGAASVTSSSATLTVANITVPDAPTGLSGTSCDTQVPLTWTAPSTNGGASIIGYVVEWTPSPGPTWTVSTGSATAGYTMASLNNGTAYAFRVAAVNSAGQGAWSSSVTVTPNVTIEAVVLTSGSSYTVPSCANSMKIWAIGAGGTTAVDGDSSNLYAGAGGVAYRTYSCTPGTNISYTVNQARTGTSDTGGSNTTVVYDGITIRAYGGDASGSGISRLITNGTNYGGGGGGYGGAVDGGAQGGRGLDLGGIDVGGSSGAVGQGGDGLDYWHSASSETGTLTSCKRRPAADVSDLFRALYLAGVNTSESCATTAAFGSGGFDAKFGPYKSPGIGGGGLRNGGSNEHRPNGSGAVVIQFSGSSVSNPKPSFTPVAYLLTSGATTGSLLSGSRLYANDFAGTPSSFQTYTVPSGATKVKAWAVGGGGTAGGGGIAYAEWLVSPGQLIYYRVGAVYHPSYVIGGHREFANTSRKSMDRLLVGGGGGPQYGGAGDQFSRANGGDGSSPGGIAVEGDNEYWGGAAGGNSSYATRSRMQPNLPSGLLDAVALAGGSANFGCGAYDSKFNGSLSPGLGGGARFSTLGGQSAGQGCVVLYFT